MASDTKMSNEDENAEEDSDPKNRSLSDVWIYDLQINAWKEITPVVKVQTSFNSKKFRKSFEPRMAHSANILGNYIIIFGGYNSKNNQYSTNNFCILSLSGCTDYMLSKPYSLK